MASSPNYDFHVPGAYRFDNPPKPSSDASFPPLGATVFLPPTDSAYLPNKRDDLVLAQSIGSLYSDLSGGGQSAENGGAKRKRVAQDSRETTPLATEWDGERGAYTMAGQIGITSESGMDDSVYSDVAYRRTLGPQSTAATAVASTVAASTTATQRWNVLYALGSVMGRMWSFCTAGAFRGFHAGGGAAYDWQTGKPTVGVEIAATEEAFPTRSARLEKVQAQRHESTPITFSNSPSVERDTTPVPQARDGKRRQVSANCDDVARNWVMVNSQQKQTHHTPMAPLTEGPLTPRKLKVPLHASDGAGGRASLSVTPTRNSIRTLDRHTSSYTRGGAVTPNMSAPRRISTPTSRMGGATPTPLGRRAGTSTASTARTAHASSPGRSSRESASFASPRTSTPTGGSRIPMPLSAMDSNPFARASAGSPRPGSRASSSLGMRGESSSMAVGRPGSPATVQGHGHRRSQSGRVCMSPLSKKTPRSFKDASDGAASSMDVSESPRLNDEAKRLAAQNLAAEQESDAKMEAFNLRLREMIRQGQQALGTTFEVNVDDGVGGGGDDDYWASD
ncbi:hypothetical protein SEPCBS57363_002086 [Sporothrix epigloea]|uniref:Uncharacterized protein n=1 Tax=Sporothrix epigloea TaxID=1892477 RepID=A0ABP0DDY4_9PEZI